MDDTENSNVTVFPGKAAPGTSGWKSRGNLPSTEQAVALLTSCLALVRPVGLSDDNARDWLRVAAGEVSRIDLDLLTEACAEARQHCTHHGQIVPRIIKATTERMEAREAAWRRERELREWDEARTRPRLPAPAPWQPTAEEIEQIKREAADRLKSGRK